MSLSLVFGREDPARVRFGVSPLWETLSALQMLLTPWHHDYQLPLLEAARADVRQLDLRPLLAVSERRGWVPDFLGPAPTGPGTDVADQLARVRATPASQVAHEVRRSLSERPTPAPEGAWRLLDDPAATRARLADLLEECWNILLAPHWQQLRDLLQADVAYRAQTLADYGLERVLGDLHPRAQWTGRALVIDRPGQARHRLAGAGLLLMPSVFVWPGLAVTIDPPARPSLVYPARGIAELWQPTQTRRSTALARLLGKTRAALLQSLAEPASTQTLARRHGLAPSTISEHLTALRDARLITSRRHRHTVMYQRTPLGSQLADPETGQTFPTRELARAYGYRDLDGSLPPLDRGI